jgi:hypothetical protein
VVERLLASQRSDLGTAPGETALQRCIGTHCTKPPDQPSS